MDSTVISTSLPVIAADLGVGPITLKLALTAYLVALAIFIPLSTWMADRFGPRRVFLIAIGVFMLGSFACALATSLGTMVAARFLQGMGGAMMTPIARAIVIRSANRADYVSAMTMFTIPAVVGPMFGPPLGGFISTYFSWEWIFLINLPIGVIGIVLTSIFIDEVPTEPPAAPDFIGLALSGIAAAGIVFGLSVISLPALPPIWGLGSIVAGVVSAFLFVRHARGHRAPALDLSLFAMPTFRCSVIAGSLFRISMGAIPFLTPLMLQIGFGMSAFQSGLITFTATFGMITTKFIAPSTLRRVGFRNALLASGVLATIGTLAYTTFYPSSPIWILIIVMVLAGLVRSFFFTSINILAFAEIQPRQTGAASAINGVFQQVSVALGIAFAGAILEFAQIVFDGGLSIANFHFTFLVVGLFTLVTILPVLALPKGAGDDISGHGTPNPDHAT